MEEIFDFIKNNLFKIIKKNNGRLDYTTEDGIVIKIYKCGRKVTRIDIVDKEK